MLGENIIVAFSTSDISLPAISIFFFNSSKIIRFGGRNFSTKAFTDCDGFHGLYCVISPESRLGCNRQSNLFPT